MFRILTQTCELVVYYRPDMQGDVVEWRMKCTDRQHAEAVMDAVERGELMPLESIESICIED